MFGPCFVIKFLVSFLFCNHLDREERDRCFTLTVFFMSGGSQCSVPLPHGVVVRSAACDCGIS